MCGCDKPAANSASRANRARNSGSAVSSGGNTFSASSRGNRGCDREIHPAHPAGAQHPQDRVSGEHLTNLKRHCQIVGANSLAPVTTRRQFDLARIGALHVVRSELRDGASWPTLSHRFAAFESGSHVFEHAG